MKQFVATANNVSLNCANLGFKFLGTDPKDFRDGRTLFPASELQKGRHRELTLLQ